MNIFEALFLGAVQGITEFLPVSSTGHLELGRILLNVNIQDNLAFIIIVHLATLLSIIIVFRKVIWDLFIALFKPNETKKKKYVMYLVISAIPVLLVKLFFDNQLDTLLSDNLLYMGICFIITGLLMWGTTKIPTNAKYNGKIDVKVSIWMGIAQSFAVLPAISRSGATIFTGLLNRVNKEEVAQFSFLMSIIPIAGASLLQIMDLVKEPERHSADGLFLLISFISAFIVGIFACKFMINIVKKQKLNYFAYYCFALGIFTIILFFVGR